MNESNYPGRLFIDELKVLQIRVIFSLDDMVKSKSHPVYLTVCPALLIRALLWDEQFCSSTQLDALRWLSFFNEMVRFIIMIDMIRFVPLNEMMRFVSLHEQFPFKINSHSNTLFIWGNNSSTLYIYIYRDEGVSDNEILFRDRHN